MTKHSRKHSSEDIARVLSQFFSVRRIIRNRMAKGMKANPSTWPQLETLKFISDNKSVRVKDVAEYLSITAPSVTSLVAGLVRLGFVNRKIDVHDKRTTQLVLSRKGKRALLTTMKSGTTLLAGVFETLSKSELEQFTDLLKRLSDGSLE